MGRVSANYTARQKQEDYKFQVILYPDSNSYNFEICMNNVKHWSQYYFIFHDQDRYNGDDLLKYEEDNDCLPTWNIGDLKKPHYHIVVVSEYPKLLGNATKSLGLLCTQGADDQSHYVQRCDNLKRCVRYLTHIDHPDKYQYSRKEIKYKSEFPPDRFFVGQDFVDDCKKINNFLSSWTFSQGAIDYSKLCSWLIENGCLQSYIRNQVMFNKVIDSLNYRYYNTLEGKKELAKMDQQKLSVEQSLLDKAYCS